MSTTSVSSVNCSDLIHDLSTFCLHPSSLCNFLLWFQLHVYKIFSYCYSHTEQKVVIYWECHLLRLYGICAKWMSEYGMVVEWYWQGRTKVLREKSIAVLLCPPQMLHGLACYWTWAPKVRGWWLAAWAMASPINMSGALCVPCPLLMYTLQNLH